MLQSISTLKEMAETLDADMTILRERIVNEDPERIVVEVLVRKCTEAQFLEIKIANLGAHDSGKSTLLGVLCHGELDNGRGKARLNTLRHYHEIASGRTSSISRQTIGFDTKGNLINYTSAQTSSTEHICEISSKLVTFLDLCGHPKYQKTTMRGLMGAAPDYTCLFVAANSGQLSDTSKDHLAFALTFSVFICITKIDVCSADQLKVTLNSLFKLLKAPGLNRIPLIIKDEDDAVTCVESFASSKYFTYLGFIFIGSCPYFCFLASRVRMCSFSKAF
jgi:GTPase